MGSFRLAQSEDRTPILAVSALPSPEGPRERPGVRSPSADFEIAYERARQQFPAEVWYLMAPREQTRAIYAALSALDASRDAERSRAPKGGSAGNSPIC